MELIDLHTHTTASDGSFSPAEVVDMAREQGLSAVGITDHDTFDGLDEALARGEATGFEVAPGIEISAEFSPGTMHMLGYFINHKDSRFASAIVELQEARRLRNPRVVEKLNQLGLEISIEEVVHAAGGGQVGRPHFAKVLVEKGYTSSFQKAFDEYLGKGRPAYVEKRRLSPADSIAMIRAGGGVPVLGHPKTLKLKTEELDRLLAELTDMGLSGLEVYYSEHTPVQTGEYKELAEKYGLTPTGGSDFHGASKLEIKLGRGFGKLRVPYECLAGLKKKKEEIA